MRNASPLVLAVSLANASTLHAGIRVSPAANHTFWARASETLTWPDWPASSRVPSAAVPEVASADGATATL